jgi:protein TonB
VSAAPKITPNDRLSMTLLFAGVVHVVLILGITFTAEERPPSSLPTLDVILVQTATAEKPDKADFLANASQSGGGTEDRALRPSETFTSAQPNLSDGVAPREIDAGAPNPTPPAPEPPPEVLTQRDSETTVSVVQQTPEQAARELPTAEELQEYQLAMARLASEVDRRKQAYAKRPKRKFITANTEEYVFASYMAGWVAKVERIGNINYPPDALRQGIEGNVLLTVAVRADGSIERMDVIRSSGNSMLDDAALRSVELAAPFGPLPRSGEEVDVLHITRTWQWIAGDMKVR